jgi:pilin isopeptide linkage protein
MEDLTMKKLRKLFTALLTTAVVCGMTAATAFASGPQDVGTITQSTAVTGLTFTKNFVSENGGILPDETFTFTMTPDTREDGSNLTSEGLSIKSGPSLGENATVKLNFGADYDSEQTGTFSFSGITFTGPAVYRYTVQEVKPENANKDITYDTTVYTIDVLVDNTSTPVAVLNAGEGSTTVVKKPIVFTNHCATDELVISKTVTGAMGDKSKSFEFTLDIPASGDNIQLAAGAKITGEIHRNGGGKDPVEFTVGGTNKFSLAHGEKLVIGNVPQGMIYTVTETACADYQTSIVGTTSTGNTQVTKNVNGNTYDAGANGQNTPVVHGGNTIAFTNHKEIIRTGIVLDIAPYLVGLALIALGAGIALVRSRKRSAK